MLQRSGESGKGHSTHAANTLNHQTISKGTLEARDLTIRRALLQSSMRDRRPQEGSAAADACAQGALWGIGRWCSAETQSVTPGSCWWFQLEGSLADLPKSWYACWHSWRSWSAACDRHCRFLDACSDNVTTGAAIMEGFTLYAGPQFPVSSLRSTTSRGSTTSEPTRSVAKRKSSRVSSRRTAH